LGKRRKEVRVRGKQGGETITSGPWTKKVTNAKKTTWKPTPARNDQYNQGKYLPTFPDPRDWVGKKVVGCGANGSAVKDKVLTRLRLIQWERTALRRPGNQRKGGITSVNLLLDTWTELEKRGSGGFSRDGEKGLRSEL